MSQGQILASEVEYSSPWLDVVAKRVLLAPPRGEEVFYSVRTTGDYAAVVAVTEDGRIPLVRQFRPAVEAVVLELPSGAVEPDEHPEAAIRRELLEETGCLAGDVVSLGALYTDSGRMQTLQWGFFAPAVQADAGEPHGDEQLELHFVEPSELRELVRSGEFRMAPHLAILALAHAHGHLLL